MASFSERLHSLVRSTERYTKTDMVYLLGGGFWINLGVIATSLMSMALYVVFANTLSPETYGTYRYLLSAAGLIGVLTLTGFNSAVVRSVARGYDGDLEASVRFQLRWAWVPALVAFATAAYYFFQQDPMLGWAFVLIGLSVPLHNAFHTYGAFLIGKKDFRRGFFYSVGVALLLYGSLAVVAFSSPASALPLIGVFLVAQLIGAVLAYRATKRHYRPSDATDPDTLSYGTHLSVMNAPNAIALQADSLIIFHLLGPAPLAIYAFATAIPNRLAGLFKFLSTTLLPKLSEQGFDQARAAVSFSRIAWMVVLILIFSGVYALAAPLVFALLFPAYDASVALSQLYAFSMIGIVGNVLGTALVAGKQVRSLYVLNVIAPGIQIVLLALGVSFFGLWGAVLAKLASTVLSIALAALLIVMTPKDDAR